MCSFTGRLEAELSNAAEEIGTNVNVIQSDVANGADIDLVYDAVREHGSQLDIVFANAGTGEFAPLGQITEEHFDKQLSE